jgi:hypothetical protein
VTMSILCSGMLCRVVSLVVYGRFGGVNCHYISGRMAKHRTLSIILFLTGLR